METLLIWLGGTPARYGTLAALCGLALLWGAWDTRRAPRWAFLLLLGLAVLAGRWPIAAHNIEVGVDDSQAIAAAMRLSAHPIPWKYVDLNTVGPLNACPLVVLSWLGCPINFTMSHLVGLVMAWLALSGAYLVLRERGDERVARCGILPATVFFALTTFFDFAYTTSEHVPMALIGIGSALLWQGAHRGVWWRVFLGCAALGATPWAKLQTVPLALWFCLAGCAVMLWRWRADRPRLKRLVLAWLGGGVAVSLLFGAVILIWGLSRQWYLAYIQQAFNYSGMGSLSFMQFWAGVAEMSRHSPEIRSFAVPLLILGTMLAGAAVFVTPRQVPTLVLVAGAAAVAAYVIAAPGRQFFHYLLLGVIPLGMLVAALLDGLLQGAGGTRPRWFAPAVLVVFLAATLLPQVHARTRRGHPAIPYKAGHIALRQSEPAKVLAAAARPGDTMTVWGWAPRLYVESGLPQATRDGMTERQIVDNPLREFYRSRYLFDLRRHRPRFFVETVGPEFFAYRDRAREGFEAWPELKAYVETHYELLAEIGSCRIYQARPEPEAPASAAPGG